MFNSYGRRANDNLLLDYGFAMIENEWDEVIIQWKDKGKDEIAQQKSKILRAHGFTSLNRVVITQRELPLEVLNCIFSIFFISLYDLLELGLLSNYCINTSRNLIYYL